MKASDGETAYSKNNKETKCSITRLFNSGKDTESPSNKKGQWMEESFFAMDSLEVPKERRDRKELSHSQALDHIEGSSSSKFLSLRKLSSDNGIH